MLVGAAICVSLEVVDTGDEGQLVSTATWPEIRNAKAGAFRQDTKRVDLKDFQKCPRDRELMILSATGPLSQRSL